MSIINALLIYPEAAYTGFIIIGFLGLAYWLIDEFSKIEPG